MRGKERDNYLKAVAYENTSPLMVKNGNLLLPMSETRQDSQMKSLAWSKTGYSDDFKHRFALLTSNATTDVGKVLLVDKA